MCVFVQRWGGTGRVGSEASMLAHIEAMTGIRHTPYPRMPPRLGKPAVWKAVEWKRWSAETPRQARMAP